MDRTIVEERSQNIVIMDVFSKLIQERIIFINGVINSELADGVIAQMLYLDSLNEKTIHIYINSPGGSVVSGLAIYDVSKIIKAPIRTVCIGEASSMGAVLMLIGKEKCGLKHSKVMLHQVAGGAIGNLSEIQITAEQMLNLQNDVYKIIENETSLENVSDLFKFDKWFNSKEALSCGIFTSIL